MKKYVFIALLIAFFAAPLSGCKENSQKSSAYDIDELTIINKQNVSHDFTVELAVRPDQQMRGLMHRTEMDEDAGMLFYFGGEEAPRSFWMKNTLIPLDLIFIKANGDIHHIHEYAIPHDLTSIKSNGPVAAVLEINGGESMKRAIQPGDRVIHRFFNQNQAQ